MRKCDLAEEMADRRACRPLPFSAETFLALVQGQILRAKWGYDFGRYDHH